MLGVKRTTCNIMIYSELGLVPLNAVRKLYILKYREKLLVTNNCILKDCYLTLFEKHNDGKLTGLVKFINCSQSEDLLKYGINSI